MHLRPGPLLRVAFLVAVAFGVSGCKPRSSGSGLRASEGYSYENYHGPNMSAPSCAANPAECVCVLSNEYDADEYRNAPLGSPKKTEWLRQCIGQEVWYKATAGSGRFHQYFQSQRLNVLPDWGWVLHSENRNTRFDAWGFLNDPDCCTPGQDCQSRGINVTMDDTYGFDYCPGDDKLLQYVGKADQDYTQADPACKISELEAKIGANARVDLTTESNAKRSDSCYLAFGTSSGALGLRKFPNPRFDAAKWRELNDGSLSSWANYSRRTPSGKPDYSDKGGKQRLDDHSVEPPFIVGETCGTCHISFNPANPPVDPNHPQWANILGAIGNPYLRVTEVLAAGIPPGTLEHELYMHARPGTVDTSAVTNDYTHNPGTFNAIINFDRRPGIVADGGPSAERFKERVKTYRRDQSGRFTESTKTEIVPHVLKGGEDSIGPAGAVQRVYLNIFSCTEACMANHLDDLKTLSGRLSRQTPFEMEQCRRDCPGYAAIEDRVYDVIDFLLRVRPTDLETAKDPEGVQGGVNGAQVVKAIMEKSVEGGEPGSWYEAGKELYGENCAKCHSSLVGQDNTAGLMSGSNVRQIDTSLFSASVDRKNDAGVRLDWLGSDVQVPASVVETYRCRSMHSNHMKGRLWESYASEEYRGSERYQSGGEAAQFNFPDEKLNASNLDGRGFYRNISLLNVWAHAPFLHNNSIGPEWKHRTGLFDIDRGSGGNWDKLDPVPTVAQRLKMFERSMEDLLKPEDERENTGSIKYKVTLTSAPIKVAMAPTLPEIPAEVFSGGMTAELKSKLQSQLKAISLELPKGMPVPVVASIRHKQLAHDLMKKVAATQGATAKVKAARDFLRSVLGPNPNDPMGVAISLREKGYANCGDIHDNRGHKFATNLDQTQQKQLIDFLKTL